MHQNIKNNNVKSIDAKLYSRKYYDFMLYKGETIFQDVNSIKKMLITDFTNLNIINGILYSDTTWSGSTNDGVNLLNIGLTGMDNGLISFKKDRITNEQFLELLTNSKIQIESGDTRLFLTPITGNTQMYEYPLFLYENFDEKYIACKGGFYQGFFKLYGYNYQNLPNKLNNEWLMHFELRPRSDYKITENLINYTHKNNEGIFFFMGIRSENKFWPFYKTNSGVTYSMLKDDAQNKGYFDGCNESGNTYNIKKNNVVHLENEWIIDEPEEETIIDSYFAVGDDYFACNLPCKTESLIGTNKQYNIVINKDLCSCNGYFNDEYYNSRCSSGVTTKFIEDEYIGSGVNITDINITDSDGHGFDEYGYQEIITDNKFLLFDRTISGYTIDNWVEGTKVTLTRRQQWPNANYFLLMNRTETGYSIDTISKYNESNEYDYSIHKDIKNNVFALRIKSDGSIGYRYGVDDCDSENRYKVEEEYSKPNIVLFDKWNNINVKFSLIGESKRNDKDMKMKIYIYVNGFLVFVSKELNAFNFKHIENECYGKQETVPYNISLGGGSLGLLETILPDYYAISDYILPIEKDFCGSFMGDIKSFKMYGDFIDYSTIHNYLS